MHGPDRRLDPERGTSPRQRLHREEPAATYAELHLSRALRSAGEIGRETAAGRSSAEETVRDTLASVALIDGSLRAFVEVTAHEARARARALDERLARGEPAPRWAGVPIAVKGRTGMSSAHTRALCAAGAIPIGVTATPVGPGPQTWGHTDRGPTRNPWRPDLSPGGSSAGSAAAVAAGIVPVATGSDGAGSARIPAAWCAIFGYKPTTGMLPGTDRSGLGVAAPLAADPRDLLGWAEIMYGGTLPPAPVPRVATWSADLGYAGAQLDDDVVAIARTAAAAFVTAVGLRWNDRPVILADPATAWAVLRAPTATPAQLTAAARLRADNDHRMAELFAATDVLLTPTTPGRAHGHDGPGDHLSVALTWSFNLSGHPAISVPAGVTDDGVPVGLQIVTRHNDDQQLLHLATRLPVAR